MSLRGLLVFCKVKLLRSWLRVLAQCTQCSTSSAVSSEKDQIFVLECDLSPRFIFSLRDIINASCTFCSLNVTAVKSFLKNPVLLNRFVSLSVE